MSEGKRYVLDANVLIERIRPITASISARVLVALVRQHEAKRLCSIDRIKDEFAAIHDHLSEWVIEKSPETFFKQTADKAVADAFRNLVNWVQNENQFTLEAKAEFLSVADGWVVAYAKVNGLVVVTHEEYAPEVKRKVPIPNVCLEFDVPCCNTFEMIRELKEQFVLRKRQRRA